MSTLNLGETNIFTDLGKVVNSTLVSNVVNGNAINNMFSLTLTKGVWICVFMYRSDQDPGGSFVGFGGSVSVGTSASASSATCVEVKKVTANTQTIYGTIYRSPSASSYTWQSGGRNCYAVKIA